MTNSAMTKSDDSYDEFRDLATDRGYSSNSQPCRYTAKQISSSNRLPSPVLSPNRSRVTHPQSKHPSRQTESLISVVSDKSGKKIISSLTSSAQHAHAHPAPLLYSSPRSGDIHPTFCYVSLICVFIFSDFPTHHEFRVLYCFRVGHIVPVYYQYKLLGLLVCLNLVSLDTFLFVHLRYVVFLAFYVVKINFEPRAKQAVKWFQLTKKGLILFPICLSVIVNFPKEDTSVRSQQWIKAK